MNSLGFQTFKKFNIPPGNRDLLRGYKLTLYKSFCNSHSQIASPDNGNGLFFFFH